MPYGIIFCGLLINQHQMRDEKDRSDMGKEDLSKADTGNASNPSPQNAAMQPAGNKQLLDEKAEKYLREVANIEDVPDAKEQQDMDEAIRKENEE